MEHPVQEWQDYAHKKWARLTSLVKEKFSPGADLEESFMACCSQLQQEDEEVLRRLCCDLSVGKEAGAVLFYKEEGNKRFGRKQYIAAAVLYSKAISHADHGTEEIAICFANRSAVLFYLGHYSVCLEDIKRAEEHGYPERLRNKILQRQAECLQKLKQPRTPTANDARMEGIALLQSQPSKDASSDKLQELKLDRNPQLTNASSSLSLQFSTSQGRHLVAAEDIGQGEVLVWEEAFASVIIPERKSWRAENKWDTRITNCDLYCHHCLERVVASLSCQHCSYAKYCSHKCMDKAWESYHHAECSLGGLLLALGVFCHTALRTVLVAGCGLVSDIVQESYSTDAKVEAPSHCIKGAHDGKYCSSYRAVFHLLPHTEKHKDERKFLCGFTTAALCKMLCIDMSGEAGKASSLSEKLPTEDANTKQACALQLPFLGPAILRHMLQLYCNAQALSVLQYEGPDSSLVESSRQSRLATAVFPVLSLLNHSCEPNTSVSFRGRCATVRASRPIKRGEDVSHCYGPHRLRLDVGERQRLLKAQYFFMCQCQACTQAQGSTESTVCDFCCPKCKSTLEGEDELQCPSSTCTNTINIHQVTRQLQQLKDNIDMAKELLRDNKTDEAIGMLISCSSEADHFLSCDHILLGEISDHLAQAQASRGDWTAAARHLRKSIRLVELRHGTSSLELGHELFKLAQILFNGREVAAAMSTIVRAQQVLTMHYESDHELVQELREMKACLSQLPGIRRSLSGDMRNKN
ncbi:protein-lysine N-methyltransferase SMYD4 isoform X2 [Ascaphus truei]